MSSKTPKGLDVVTVSVRKPSKATHRYGLLVAGLVVAGLVVFAMVTDIRSNDVKECSFDNIAVSQSDIQFYKASKERFSVEWATKPPQQEKGLSYRPCFPKNGALLFTFPTDDRFGIWMKDMNFPIDVVWLDKDKHIVTIEKDMEPSTYPKVFYPSADARYVIEFNKGTMDTLGAHAGETFDW